MKVSKALAALTVFVGTSAYANEPAPTGEALYGANCSSCHQADGGGVPMLQPELIEKPRANGPKGGVIDMILFGSASIAVSESDYGNEMPSFAQLTDLEIAMIATYVRTHFENNGGPVTSDDVKSRRPK